MKRFLLEKYRIICMVVWVVMLALSYEGQAIACDLCTLGGFGGTTGAINPTSADAPAKNKFTVGYMLEYQDWESVDIHKAHALHEEGRDAHARKNDISNSIFLGYGITDAFSVSLQLPYVERRSKEVHDHELLGDDQTSSGLGDSILLGKYKFYDKQFGLAGIFGFKLPTGTTNERNESGEKFEPELQPGTGSLDYIFGLSANKRINHWLLLDSNCLYHLRTEGEQDYEFGDMVRATVGATVNVISGENKPTFNVISEMISQFANKDEHASETVYDSGGTTLFFAPGVSSQITKQLTTTLSAPIPFYQALGGQHQELDFSILFSIRYDI